MIVTDPGNRKLPYKIGVHVSHCCVLHGCKYGDKTCPVVKKKYRQDYPCEDCEHDQIKGLPDPADPNYDLLKMHDLELREECRKLRQQVKGPVKLGKRNVVIEVEYHELEQFVGKVYPFLQGYSFVAVQECGNDCAFNFAVDAKEMTSYDKKAWEAVKSGKEPIEHLGNGLLLCQLCRDGHIEPGEYNVSVCW